MKILPNKLTIQSKGEQLMSPFTNICKYKERCPSATGWCFNKQPDEDCLFYLNTHLHSVNRDLNNTIELIEIIERKESGT